MRIAVIGAGAMGGLFGARLANAGHELAFVEVSEPTIEVIRAGGLRLLGEGTDIHVWPEIGRANHFTDPFDLLIVFTKGFHTAKAIDDVRHLLTPSTWVLSVQNGLGNAELISRTVSRDRIIVGMTDYPAQLQAPGTVYSQGHGRIKIWSFTGEIVSRVMVIAGLFDDAGLRCSADPQVEVFIWEKLAFNAALNSICAVSGLTVGEVASAQGGREMAMAVAREAVSVALANGVSVDEVRIMASIDHAFVHHATHKPSMLQDVEAGRRTENEFIAGAIVKKGLSAGVHVPVTQCLHALIGMKELL